jgi:hypothetical protein
MQNKSQLTQRVKESIKLTTGLLGTIIILDILTNLLFPYPKDPQNTSPNKIALYFDYGRSIEGKVKRQLGINPEKSAPIALAGWLNPLDKEILTSSSINQEKQSIKVTIYGMSFSSQVGEAMQKINPQIILKKIAGPAAPPNHSFAAYNLNKDDDESDVVIWGILASSVAGLDAMSGMTVGGEVPAPFTFPKYEIKEDKLQVIFPEIDSIEDLIKSKQDRQLWVNFVNQIKNYDSFYNSFSFHENILDNSTIMRMIRRSWTQNNKQKIFDNIHTSKGFNEEWKEIQVLNKMIKEFNETARKDEKLPIILVINDRGYDDHLFKIINQTLEEESIHYISTHNISPATNLSNFVSDGHFTKKANLKIAEKVLDLIEKEH